MAIPAYFARLGLHAFGLVLAAAIALFLMWLVYKTKPGLITISGIALCAAILCAPLSWADYVLFLAPFFVWRRWNLPANFAAALLAVPSFVPMSLSAPPGTLGVLLGSGIYFAAIWIILFVFASQSLPAAGALRQRADRLYDLSDW
jgi:hypothetical protein